MRTTTVSDRIFLVVKNVSKFFVPEKDFLNLKLLDIAAGTVV